MIARGSAQCASGGTERERRSRSAAPLSSMHSSPRMTRTANSTSTMMGSPTSRTRLFGSRDTSTVPPSTSVAMIAMPSARASGGPGGRCSGGVSKSSTFAGAHAMRSISKFSRQSDSLLLGMLVKLGLGVARVAGAVSWSQSSESDLHETESGRVPGGGPAANSMKSCSELVPSTFSQWFSRPVVVAQNCRSLLLVA